MSRRTWTAAFRALGTSVFELIRAEIRALLADWKKAGIELAKIFALAFGALLVFVYLPFLALFALVDGVAAWWGWPLWAAALAVLGFAVLVIAILGAVAAWIWKKRFVAPTTSLRRRIDDHRQWWERSVYFETTGETRRGTDDEPEKTLGGSGDV